jgi:hypothetical protein
VLLGATMASAQIDTEKRQILHLGYDASLEGHAPIAAYAVKVYGDGHQLDALGPLPAAEIVSIFKATAQQAHALRH